MLVFCLCCEFWPGSCRVSLGRPQQTLTSGETLSKYYTPSRSRLVFLALASRCFDLYATAKSTRADPVAAVATTAIRWDPCGMRAPGPHLHKTRFMRTPIVYTARGLQSGRMRKKQYGEQPSALRFGIHSPVRYTIIILVQTEHQPFD